MIVRKYLFWMTDKGIQTYKVANGGNFELIKFRGEDTYDGTDLKKFGEWFNKMASIAGDEYIDFCYLSDKPVEFPVFMHDTQAKSSWDKQEITAFCNRCIDIANFEVVVDDQHSFVCQSGNILDQGQVEKVYLKCIPEFVLETEKPIEKKEGKSEQTSLVNRYFMDMLRELNEK